MFGRRASIWTPPYPTTQAQYDQAAAAEAKAALAKAAALRASNKPVVTAVGGHHNYTLKLVGSVKDGVTVYRFPAQTLTISRGDTVTWLTQDPTELHTVSFGVGTRNFDIVTMQHRPQGPPVPQVTPATLQPSGGPVHRGAGFYRLAARRNFAAMRSRGTRFAARGRDLAAARLHLEIARRTRGGRALNARARATARGSRSITRSSVRAGPSGCVRPCSHSWIVRTLRPNRRANSSCVSPARARTRRTYSGGTTSRPPANDVISPSPSSRM